MSEEISSIDGEIVKIVKVSIEEIRCTKCDEVIGQMIVDNIAGMEIYCGDCYSTLEDEKKELEDNIDKVREFLGF